MDQSKQSASRGRGSLITNRRAFLKATSVVGGASVMAGKTTADVIEEDVYYNDLILDLDIPVVFVGAMRPADADNADGPANLLTAVRTVTRREFHLENEASGVYVAINDGVHAARDVTKTDTHKVETFESGLKGPVAIFTDDELLLYRDPGSYSADLSQCTTTDKNIPIVTIAAGVNAFIIEQTLEGNYDADGFLIKVVGRSGSSPDLLEAREQAVNTGYPVVRTSLNATGPVAPTDAENDEITAGDLNGRKARLHLMLVLETTSGFGDIQTSFDESGYGLPVVAPSTIEVDPEAELETETDDEDEN